MTIIFIVYILKEILTITFSLWFTGIECCTSLIMGKYRRAHAVYYTGEERPPAQYYSCCIESRDERRRTGNRYCLHGTVILGFLSTVTVSPVAAYTVPY